jgi:hypothetical protein
MLKHFILTPAAGKRLIGRALAAHPAIKKALSEGTICIVAGTTNGYVAEEVLGSIGQTEGFEMRRFFRGVTLPPLKKRTESGRLPDEGDFPGDVVIARGQWQTGKTIFDVVDDLKEGDVILKGANALDVVRGRAAILIGHPQAGTIGAALQAVAGRRVRLILPVGMEKRVYGDLDTLAAMMNAPEAKGPRLLPVPGEVFTELDAVELLCGASAELLSAGGVGGAEGSAWLVVNGEEEQLNMLSEVMDAVAGEPQFAL